MPRRERHTRSPRVRLHKDGRVTISGLTQQDAQSLLTMAKLYWYSEEKKRDAMSEEQRKEHGHDDPCNIAYHDRMRFIIDTLENFWSSLRETDRRKIELSDLERNLGRKPTRQDILKHDLTKNKQHRRMMDYITGRAQSPDEEPPPPIKVTKPVPAFGAIFTYEMGGQPTKFRVSGWMKTCPPIKSENWLERILHTSQQKIDGRRLMWCTREEAEYVCGYGVCGCIAQVNDIIDTGAIVAWPKERIAEDEQSYLNRMVGEVLS